MDPLLQLHNAQNALALAETEERRLVTIFVNAQAQVERARLSKENGMRQSADAAADVQRLRRNLAIGAGAVPAEAFHEVLQRLERAATFFN